MELVRNKGASGQASLGYQADSSQKYCLGEEEWQTLSNDGTPISIFLFPITPGSRLYALGLPLARCETLGQPLNLSVLEFSHL